MARQSLSVLSLWLFSTVRLLNLSILLSLVMFRAVKKDLSPTKLVAGFTSCRSLQIVTFSFIMLFWGSCNQFFISLTFFSGDTQKTQAFLFNRACFIFIVAGNSVLWCIEALRFSGTVAITGILRLIRFTLFNFMFLINRFPQLLRCEVALHFINTWDINDFTFDYYWKQLQLPVWRYVCVCMGSFVLDYHALYLQHFMSIE